MADDQNIPPQAPPWLALLQQRRKHVELGLSGIWFGVEVYRAANGMGSIDRLLQSGLNFLMRAPTAKK